MRPSLICYFGILLFAGACSSGVEGEPQVVAQIEAPALTPQDHVSPVGTDHDRIGHLRVDLPAGAPSNLAGATLTYVAPQQADVPLQFGTTVDFVGDRHGVVRLCYGPVCDDQSVTVFRKQTVVLTLGLVRVVFPPKPTLPPQPPAPAFGRRGETRWSLVPTAVHGNHATMASDNPSLPADVIGALDGSGDFYLPVLPSASRVTCGYCTPSGDTSVTVNVASTPILVVHGRWPEAQTETPSSIDVIAPQRDYPDAIPTKFTLFNAIKNVSPQQLGDDTYFGSHDATAESAILPALQRAAAPTLARAKSIPISSGSYSVYSAGSAKYGFVLNDTQVVLLNSTGGAVRVGRIDVDDPVITDEATNTTYTVAGTWRVTKVNDSHPLYNAWSPTRTGVDVLPGEYEVTARFTTALEGAQQRSYRITIGP